MRTTRLQDRINWITAEAFGRWERHQEAHALECVTHLTKALPSLAAVNGHYQDITDQSHQPLLTNLIDRLPYSLSACEAIGKMGRNAKDVLPSLFLNLEHKILENEHNKYKGRPDHLDWLNYVASILRELVAWVDTVQINRLARCLIITISRTLTNDYAFCTWELLGAISGKIDQSILSEIVAIALAKIRQPIYSNIKRVYVFGLGKLGPNLSPPVAAMVAQELIDCMRRTADGHYHSAASWDEDPTSLSSEDWALLFRASEAIEALSTCLELSDTCLLATQLLELMENSEVIDMRREAGNALLSLSVILKGPTAIRVAETVIDLLRARKLHPGVERNTWKLGIGMGGKYGSQLCQVLLKQLHSEGTDDSLQELAMHLPSPERAWLVAKISKRMCGRLTFEPAYAQIITDNWDVLDARSGLKLARTLCNKLTSSKVVHENRAIVETLAAVSRSLDAATASVIFSVFLALFNESNDIGLRMEIIAAFGQIGNTGDIVEKASIAEFVAILLNALEEDDLSNSKIQAKRAQRNASPHSVDEQDRNLKLSSLTLGIWQSQLGLRVFWKDQNLVSAAIQDLKRGYHPIREQMSEITGTPG